MWLTVGKVLKAFNKPPLFYHRGWRMVRALMSSLCLSSDRNLKCVSQAQSSSFTQPGFIDACVSFVMLLRNVDVFDPPFFLSLSPREKFFSRWWPEISSRAERGSQSSGWGASLYGCRKYWLIPVRRYIRGIAFLLSHPRHTEPKTSQQTGPSSALIIKKLRV